MGVALAALLGQIGLPGGGFGHGYASAAVVGRTAVPPPAPGAAAGRRTRCAPSSRARRSRTCSRTRAAPSTTTASVLRLPDIRLVYWCGGNPFHHHQDLNRLRRALQRVDTVVVHDPFWTPMARHADIVLPEHRRRSSATTSARPTATATSSPCHAPSSRTATHATTTRPSPTWRRRSASGTSSPRAAPRATGSSTSTSEIRGALDGARHRRPAVRRLLGGRRGPAAADARRPHRARAVPRRSRRARASTRRAAASSCSRRPSTASATTTAPAIRRGSSPTSGCGGPRAERVPAAPHRQPAGDAAAQPARRRPSQPERRRSRAARPIRIHPDDAAARGIADGDVVRVFNDRGACYAGAVVTDRRAARASSTCRPARGSPRSTRPTRARRARTATRTCSPPTAAAHASPRAAPASTSSSRSSGPATRRRSTPTARHDSSTRRGTQPSPAPPSRTRSCRRLMPVNPQRSEARRDILGVDRVVGVALVELREVRRRQAVGRDEQRAGSQHPRHLGEESVLQFRRRARGGAWRSTSRRRSGRHRRSSRWRRLRSTVTLVPSNRSASAFARSGSISTAVRRAHTLAEHVRRRPVARSHLEHVVAEAPDRPAPTG